MASWMAICPVCGEWENLTDQGGNDVCGSCGYVGPRSSFLAHESCGGRC